MSWRTLNTILGLAMVDAKFAQRLVANPLVTVQEYGFDLTETEMDILRQIRASDVSELSRILVDTFCGKDRSP